MIHLNNKHIHNYMFLHLFICMCIFMLVTSGELVNTLSFRIHSV